jgi:hypothetical protein
MSDQRTPDALFVPQQASPDAWARAEKTTVIARELLNMPDGPPPFVEYGQPSTFNGKLCHFVRRSVEYSRLFPTGHARAGEDRYEWADGPDGTRLGYLKAD